MRNCLGRTIQVLKLLLITLSFGFGSEAFAQTGNLNLPGLSVNFGQGTDLVDTLQVLVLFTITHFSSSIYYSLYLIYKNNCGPLFYETGDWDSKYAT
jgi:hypothetical protein